MVESKESLLNPNPIPNLYTGKNIFRKCGLYYDQMLRYIQQAIDRNIGNDKENFFRNYYYKINTEYSHFKQSQFRDDSQNFQHINYSDQK